MEVLWLNAPKTVPSAGKVIASFCLVDADGILMVDYLRKEQPIIGIYYAWLLRQLRKNMKVQCRRKLSKCVLFHHDNAPAHASISLSLLWLSSMILAFN